MDVQELTDQQEILQQFCTDTRCNLEDLAEAMDDCDEWREREREGGDQGNPC